MKATYRAIISISITIVSLIGIRVDAQTTLQGNRLDIRTTTSGSSNTLTGLPSGALGDLNVVSGGWSMSVGYSNTVSGLASMSVGQNNSVAGLRALSVGFSNTINASSSLTIGNMNTINTDSSDNGHYSLVVGNMNISNLANNSLIVGANNLVSIAAPNSSTLGYGLTNSWGQCLLIGQYNTSTIKITTGPLPLFVVGCGTGTAAPQNAIEVYTSGDVVIPKAQGDILMGAFGN